MTRTLAIAKRTLLELFRDKRTLALIFLAPILILTLLNYVFTLNTSTNIEVGTVNVSSSITKNIDSIDHVKVRSYASESAAQDALKHQKIDAVLQEKGDQQFSIWYSNTDASKTAMTRNVVNAAFTKTKTAQLATAVGQMAQQLGVQPQNVQAVQLSEHYNYGDKDTNYFASIMPIFMGFFVFLFVFLISGISLLKERTSGTLNRLLATPVRRSEIIYGYMLSYGLVAIIQTAIIVFFTVYVLKVEVVGSLGLVFLINVLLALVALAFGLLISTLANSEFQMMQFIPIVVVPQLIFSGIIPLGSMATWAQVIGDILPMKYASNAMTDVVLYGRGLGQISGDLLALAIFLVVLVALNIAGLRRYRKV
ncbi:ABC transporter permease [Leuconostocaceae bacterium ESL0723]|nr:ABC transporter permease [Leuconostocaceae bacterium ESL0723]